MGVGVPHGWVFRSAVNYVTNGCLVSCNEFDYNHPHGIGLNEAGEADEVGEAQLPLPRNNTQVRASGRKRKSRDDDIFEYH
jgi:hypothetical protein